MRDRLLKIAEKAIERSAKSRDFECPFWDDDLDCVWLRPDGITAIEYAGEFTELPEGVNAAATLAERWRKHFGEKCMRGIIDADDVMAAITAAEAVYLGKTK